MEYWQDYVFFMKDESKSRISIFCMEQSGFLKIKE
jgi:hypothetical protein